jgi:hypothetical protein
VRFPSDAVRGKPRPNSPKRIGDQRAAAVVTSSAGMSVRPRIIAALALMVIVALVVITLLWLSSVFLDDAPAVSMRGQMALGSSQSAVTVASGVEPVQPRVAGA